MKREPPKKSLFARWRDSLRPRGKVLEARFGYNPNSSSLGADLTPLLLLSSLMTIAVPSLLLYFQSRTKKGEGSPVGEAGQPGS